MTNFERCIARIEDAFAAVAILILVACTASVCVDVVLRYAFNAPLVWATEITEYALVYITFLAIAWAVPRRGHVVVDVVVSALPPRGQALCQLFNNLVALGVASVLAVWGTTTTLDAFARKLFKPTVLSMPTWIVLVIIPLGCALLAARLLIETWKAAGDLVSGRAPGAADSAAPGLE